MTATVLAKDAAGDDIGDITADVTLTSDPSIDVIPAAAVPAIGLAAAAGTDSLSIAVSPS